jgi:hypothetical protein
MNWIWIILVCGAIAAGIIVCFVYGAHDGEPAEYDEFHDGDDFLW